MDFPKISESVRIKRLNSPRGMVNMVLDTDTFNEIDDQFALVYALLSRDRINLKAVTAAPFHNDRSTGPADGMEQSYKEILRLFKKMSRPPENMVFRGSLSYLPDGMTPCPSDGAARLIKLAREAPENDPLYVAAVGALTNVASALLTAPDIIHKIVVVWLGGHALYWPHTREFNLKQDVAAARLIFDSAVPLVHIPCLNVTDHLSTTVPELKAYIKGKNPVANFLFKRFTEYSEVHRGWSKPLWDMAAVAWLINADWMPSDLAHSPILNENLTWSRDDSRHLIRTVREVHRDPIFQDFFDKITEES